MDKSQGIPPAILKVLSEAPIPIEPRQRAFDDPAFRQDNEAFNLITSCDDLESQRGPDFRDALPKHRPLIGPIREERGEERKAFGQRRE